MSYKQIEGSNSSTSSISNPFKEERLNNSNNNGSSSVIFNADDSPGDSNDYEEYTESAREKLINHRLAQGLSADGVNEDDNPFRDHLAADDDAAFLDDDDHFHNVDFNHGSGGAMGNQYSNVYSNIDFDKAPDTKFKGLLLLYFTSAFVSLGVFVFGYDQGVMSGIITERSFVQFFDDPTKAQIGTMVAILELGALASSLSVGRVGDLIGRKKTILVGAAVFVVGGFLQSFSGKMFVLIIGRIISGIAIGLLSAIVPIYQTEISPPASRGRLGCIQWTGNIFGYTASVWVDYWCSFATNQFSWRTPLFIQSLLGLALFVGGFFIVESPRWLLENNKDAQGFEVLNLLFADSPQGTAKNEFEIIKSSVISERLSAPPETRTYKVMFKRYWYRLLIACSAQMWAQINGINVICYYAPMLFEQAGFKNKAALLVTGLNALVYLASTVPPWFLVDKWGRKPILMSGGLVMGVSLLTISYAMWLDKSFTPAVVAVFVFVFNAGFGYSWGPIPWLMCEILPLQIRAKGASLSTATNWVFNYLVGQMTPILQVKMRWGLYFMHGTFCICSVIFVYRFFPETRGVELEEMDKIFNDNPDTNGSKEHQDADDDDDDDDDEDDAYDEVRRHRSARVADYEDEVELNTLRNNNVAGHV